MRIHYHISMNRKSSSLIYFLSIVLCAISSCSSHEIVLDKVSYIPYDYEYFHSNLHFGKEIKTMELKNEFILIVGSIDTTSETPPIKLAFISINNKTIQLNLLNENIQNDQVIREYTGNGYELLVRYPIKPEGDHSRFSESHLIIKNGKLRSEYDLICESGYY